MFDFNFGPGIADSMSGLDAASMGGRVNSQYNRPIGPSIPGGSRDSFAARFAQARGAGRADWRKTSTLGVAFKGGLSAISPIEDPLAQAGQQVREKVLGDAGKKAAGLLPKSIKNFGAAALKGVARWGGPVTTAYRLGYDNDFSSVGGFASKSTRIIGEEIAWGAGAAIGMKMGSAIGAGIGTTFVPGVGTVAGFAAGMVIGAGIGMVGSYSVNKAIDAAEVPFKIGAAGYRYLRNTGKDRRLELGGQISAGNASRQGYTMRQRALSQMNRSGINTRSLLGQEASMMHIR